MLGVIEATVEGDQEKNRLCPPLPYWDENEDYLSAFLATLTADRVRAAHPRLTAWAKATRLNPLSRIASYGDDARVIEARERIKRHAPAAVTNLPKLVAAGRQEAARTR